MRYRDAILLILLLLSHPLPGTAFTPKLLKSFPQLTATEHQVLGIQEVRESVYVLHAGTAGPAVLDAADAHNAKVSEHKLQTEGVVSRVAWGGDQMFTAEGSYMGAFEISPQGLAERAGTLRLKKLEGEVTCLVAGPPGYVYIFTSGKVINSFNIVNVADLTLPFSLGRMNIRGKVVDAVADRGMMYAVTENGYILSYDISQPSKFDLRSETNTMSTISSITIFLEFLYVGVGDELRIYNNENPAELEEAVRLPIASTVKQVQFQGGHIYMATHAGLAVVEVFDPRKPRLVGFYPTEGRCRSMAVRDFVAFIADDAGVHAVLAARPPEDAPLVEEVAAAIVHKVLVDNGTLPKDTPAPATPVPPVPTQPFFVGEVLAVEGDPPPPPPPSPSPTACSFFSVPTQKEAVSRGMSAWADVPGSYWEVVPAWLTEAHLPLGELPQGTPLVFRCCSEKPCSMRVFLEHCLPCTSQTNGGLPSLLLVNGWAPSPCGPSFALGPGKPVRRTVAFHKVIAPGEEEVVGTLPRPARFLGFSAWDGNACASAFDASSCLVNSGCQWDYQPGGDGVCIERHHTCSSQDSTRTGVCDSCAKDDLE